MEQMMLKMELDKREAQAKATAEVDTRKAQARCDKLEANAKAEAEKREVHARCDKLEALLEKERAQARYDKLEANSKTEKEIQATQARCDKLEVKAKMDKRDTEVKYKTLEAALETERKDRLLQQQIAQLKQEARPGQMPHLPQLMPVMYGSQPSPSQVYGQPTPPTSATGGASASAAAGAAAVASYILQSQQTAPAVDPAVPSPTQALPTSPLPRRILAKSIQIIQPPTGVNSGAQRMREEAEKETEKPSSSQSALNTLPASPGKVMVTSTAIPVALLSSKKHQTSPLPVQQPSIQQPSPPSLSSSTPASAKLVQQQQSHHRKTVPANVGAGAVSLPGNAQSHFFLSHSQSTGGDQTNAIYLELQQLGFTCW
jgi:hypothetical protein